MSLKIDAEFASLIPAHTPEERNLLEAALEKDGCRDPLVIWAGHDTILDGHNRHAFCTRFKIPFKTTELSLATRDEAKDWIINNQLARRNLTDEQKSYLRGKRYEQEKKKDGPPAGNTNYSGSKSQGSQRGNLDKTNGKTVTRVAVESGVSPQTIIRDEAKAKAVDKLAKHGGQAARDAILSGNVKFTVDDAKAINDLPAPEAVKVAEAIASGSTKKVADVLNKSTPAPEEPKNGRTPVGVLRANEAINCLTRIPKNDAQRKRGFQLVTDWIRRNK